MLRVCDYLFLTVTGFPFYFLPLIHGLGFNCPILGPGRLHSQSRFVSDDPYALSNLLCCFSLLIDVMCKAISLHCRLHFVCLDVVLVDDFWGILTDYAFLTCFDLPRFQQ
jgi:hypothetical protein